mmetsp:Transcript_20852/g.48721  ORF Transcript_20852/g.48721 Transcript_20852/m.48721 type:complete len:168 (-) Transcript_20852:361-864(-)
MEILERLRISKAVTRKITRTQYLRMLLGLQEEELAKLEQDDQRQPSLALKQFERVKSFATRMPKAMSFRYRPSNSLRSPRLDEHAGEDEDQGDWRAGVRLADGAPPQTSLSKSNSKSSSSRPTTPKAGAAPDLGALDTSEATTPRGSERPFFTRSDIEEPVKVLGVC